MSVPLKNATLRQLATFHTLVRLRSISQTAEEMHLTQPAVSLQLGILEESAGTPLLTRSARGVKLTEAGELLATYADRMLALWREAGEAMAAQRGLIAGTLRIGAMSTRRPSTCTAPLPSRAACAIASTMRRALVTSSGDGLNTALAAAICVGWIAHLPS